MIVAALVLTQIAVLHAFGQPFMSASGRILLWVNDPFSADNSQQLADWYSFSHGREGVLQIPAAGETLCREARQRNAYPLGLSTRLNR